MTTQKAISKKPRHFIVWSTAAVLCVAVLGYSFWAGNAPKADANIAVLYASSCLGGWKHTNNITGAPDVTNADIQYTEENSATLYNKQTQLFCGGFSGTIPETADRTKIALKFSWSTEGVDTETEESEDDASHIETPISSGNTEASTTSTVNQEPAAAEELPQGEQETQPEERVESSPEPEVPVQESVSWLRNLIPSVHAEENFGEVAADVVSPEAIAAEELVVEEFLPVTPSGDDSEATTTALAALDSTATATATTSATTSETSFVPTLFEGSKDDALFEVKFTTNDKDWHILGYVTRINNDIQFELPLEMFASVEDINTLQISLETVERFDDTPKIYLDSMWIEVSYLDAGQDPLSPPGTLAGDVIVSKYETAEMSLVTVFRNVSLETTSNLFVAASSTATSSPVGAATTTSTTTPEAVDALLRQPYSSSTASSTILTYESDIPLEMRRLMRETPGVLVEIWFYSRTTDSWTRVADNTIVATDPKAMFFDGRVFWFGADNTSLWLFDTPSQAYDSRSLTPNEPIEIEYKNTAGEEAVVGFNAETGTLEPVAIVITP